MKKTFELFYGFVVSFAMLLFEAFVLLKTWNWFLYDVRVLNYQHALGLACIIMITRYKYTKTKETNVGEKAAIYFSKLATYTLFLLVGYLLHLIYA